MGFWTGALLCIFWVFGATQGLHSNLGTVHSSLNGLHKLTLKQQLRLTYYIGILTYHCCCFVAPLKSSASTGCLSRLSYHCMTLPIRKAQLPQKVARLASYCAPLLPYAGPSAPQIVKPNAPARFQKPICHPSTPNAGRYHALCVSSMNSVPETMKPVPPTI